MKPGPPKTPTSLRILRGNPSKRALPKDEPQPGALSSTVPRELTGDDERAEWRRTIVPSIRLGIVTVADRGVAIAHCSLWATWRSQLAAAERHGHVMVAGPNRYPIPNPARGMGNKTLALLLRVDAELGLTPAARSRVSVPSEPPADELTAFLAKGRSCSA